MTDRPIRITINGKPHAEYELTREIALQYQPGPKCPDPDCKFGKRRLPDDWDPNVLSISHLIGVQQRALILGATGLPMYLLNPEALMQVEAAVVASRVPDEYVNDSRWSSRATASGRVCMTFRGIPVMVTKDVPWVDLDWRTPERQDRES